MYALKFSEMFLLEIKDIGGIIHIIFPITANLVLSFLTIFHV